MAVQHQDPLVFNAFAQTWQNASNAGPSGQPIGLSIGAPGGSSVAMLPNVGFTIQADGGSLGAILAAHSYDTASFTETVPGYLASVVFNSGAADEQLGLLFLSPLSQGTAQAILQLADSADGTIKGTTKHGTITPGTTATWNFTTAFQVVPATASLQVAPSFTIQSTDPVAGSVEDWHTVAVSGTGFPGGQALNYTMLPLGSTGAVALQWYWNHTAGTVSGDGTQVATLPAAYAPTGAARLACATDALGVGGGQTKACHIRVVSNGAVQTWGVNAAATFVAGSAIYPLTTTPGG